jgi:hypothetical protein
MRLIPEYQPVGKLYLSFVHEFFNTRFRYGKAICEIIKAAHPYVEVELFVAVTDLPHLRREFEWHQVEPQTAQLNFDSPARAILAEYVPVFAEGKDGGKVGLVFKHPRLDGADELEAFSRRLLDRLGVQPLEMNMPFATAQLAVNESVVLLSEEQFAGPDSGKKLAFLREHFPCQTFHVVPSLAGDICAGYTTSSALKIASSRSPIVVM